MRNRKLCLPELPTSPSIVNIACTLHPFLLNNFLYNFIDALLLCTILCDMPRCTGDVFFTEAVKMGGGENVSLFQSGVGISTRMEGRTSRSLSGLAEAGAGEEKSLLGNKEGEKVITSLETLVPEEEVEATLSINQVRMQK